MSIPTTDRRASEVLYDEISKSRNSVRRDNVRALRKVCDQMEKDKVPMTVAEVVRRCVEAGPAYSTVSNKGSPLGEYVRLRIVEQGSVRATRTAKESIADTVTDPVLQAQIREKEETAKWVSRENNGLRILLKNLRPGVDIDKLLENPQAGVPTLQVVPVIAQRESDPELGGALIKLVSHLINDRNYRELKGRFTINGKIVLGTDELAAVRRATGFTDEEWNVRFQSETKSAT